VHCPGSRYRRAGDRLGPSPPDGHRFLQLGQSRRLTIRYPSGCIHPWRVSVDPDVSVMAHSWHIRVRLWTFAVVRRVADLPFQFAVVRRIRLEDFPKLSTLPLHQDVGCQMPLIVNMKVWHRQ
jgi:hypothetical protein